METAVRTPDDQLPCTLAEVLRALKNQGLQVRHEAADWGDWIYVNGSTTVISIESMRGLTSSATVEQPEEESREEAAPVFTAFHKLGWIGFDEEGEFPLV